MLDFDNDDPEYWAWVESEKKSSSLAFERTAYRHTSRKRQLTCGCWIDGGEPYRYMVWKVTGDLEITQRSDCEFCARRDEGRER